MGRRIYERQRPVSSSFVKAVTKSSFGLETDSKILSSNDSGSKLLFETEKIAKGRGCDRAYLDTL